MHTPEPPITVDPPRLDGTPWSVWLAATLLLGPAAALVVLRLTGRFDSWVLAWLPFLFLTIPAYLLFDGNEVGVTCSLVYALLAGGLAAQFTVLAVIAALERGVVLTTAAVFFWATLLGGSVWWPATRRWCGMLPPTPDHADD